MLPVVLSGRPAAPTALVALVGVAFVALLAAAPVLLAPDRRIARERGTGTVLQGIGVAAVLGALAAGLGGASQPALVLASGAAAALLLAAFVVPETVGVRETAVSERPEPSARPMAALLATVVLAVPYLGLPRLEVAVDPARAFPPGSGPHEAQMFLDRHFGGTDAVIVAIRGDVATPEALDALRALEATGAPEPAVREVFSFLGAVRTGGVSEGRPSELPLSAGAVRRFVFMGSGQKGLGQIFLPDSTGLAVYVNLLPGTPAATAERVRDAMLGEVPSISRFRTFAEADPALRERMAAEVAERLSLRLAGLGIPAERRVPALLLRLLAAVEKGTGPDRAAIARALRDGFPDGVAIVLVADMDTGEPLAIGDAEIAALADRLAAAGAIDESTVTLALVAQFPSAAEDPQGLELEVGQLMRILGRIDLGAGDGKSALPEDAAAWVREVSRSDEQAAAATAALLQAAGEIRQGGVALPAPDGVTLSAEAGGLPLIADAIRAGTLASLTLAFLVVALAGLVLWTILLLMEGIPFSRAVGTAVPLVLLAPVAASAAFGGAGYLGLIADPGAPGTLGACLAVAGALGALLALPWIRVETTTAAVRRDAGRVVLFLGPALAAAGACLAIVPLPPARTLGFLVAAAVLAALILGWCYAGRRR
jgi:hypothetical protein